MDEIRSVLEAHAIRSMTEWEAVDAARRATAVLRDQHESVERGNAVEAARLDADFHLVLASYTKNETLRSLLQELIAAARPRPWPSTRCPTRPSDRSASTSRSWMRSRSPTSRWWPTSRACT